MEDKTLSLKQIKISTPNTDKPFQAQRIERALALLRPEKQPSEHANQPQHSISQLWSLFSAGLQLDKERFMEVVGGPFKLSPADRKSRMYIECLARNANIRGIIRRFGQRVSKRRGRGSKQDCKRSQTKSSTCFSEHNSNTKKAAISLQKTKARLTLKVDNKNNSNKPTPSSINIQPIKEMRPQVAESKENNESGEGRRGNVRIRKSVPKATLAEIEQKRVIRRIEVKLDDLIKDVKSTEQPPAEKRQRVSILKSVVFDSTLMFQAEAARRALPTEKGYYMRRFQRLSRGALGEQAAQASQQYVGKSKFNKSFLLL